MEGNPLTRRMKVIANEQKKTNKLNKEIKLHANGSLVKELLENHLKEINIGEYRIRIFKAIDGLAITQLDKKEIFQLCQRLMVIYPPLDLKVDIAELPSSDNKAPERTLRKLNRSNPALWIEDWLTHYEKLEPKKFGFLLNQDIGISTLTKILEKLQDIQFFHEDVTINQFMHLFKNKRKLEHQRIKILGDQSELAYFVYLISTQLLKKTKVDWLTATHCFCTKDGNDYDNIKLSNSRRKKDETKPKHQQIKNIIDSLK
jgi:hypothetical protein